MGAPRGGEGARKIGRSRAHAPSPINHSPAAVTPPAGSGGMKGGIGTFRPDPLPSCSLVMGPRVYSLMSVARPQKRQRSKRPLSLSPSLFLLPNMQGREGGREYDASLHRAENGVRSQVSDGEEESLELDLCV